MHTTEDIVRHELLGRAVRVKACNDASKEGITGTVIDETQKTFVIKEHGEQKVVPKKESVFVFDTDHGSVTVAGHLLIGRAAERIQQPVPHRWDM